MHKDGAVWPAKNPKIPIFTSISDDCQISRGVKNAALILSFNLRNCQHFRRIISFFFSMTGNYMLRKSSTHPTAFHLLVHSVRLFRKIQFDLKRPVNKGQQFSKKINAKWEFAKRLYHTKYIQIENIANKSRKLPQEALDNDLAFSSNSWQDRCFMAEARPELPALRKSHWTFPSYIREKGCDLCDKRNRWDSTVRLHLTSRSHSDNLRTVADWPTLRSRFAFLRYLFLWAHLGCHPLMRPTMIQRCEYTVRQMHLANWCLQWNQIHALSFQKIHSGG